MFLHSRGYFGPVGIDAMTDDLDSHNVVDLNLRIAGSFIPYSRLPATSFTRVGLDCAYFMPYIGFAASRENFKAAFDKELCAGKLVILTGFLDPTTSRSFVCFAVGGKTEAQPINSEISSISWPANIVTTSRRFTYSILCTLRLFCIFFEPYYYCLAPIIPS